MYCMRCRPILRQRRTYAHIPSPSPLPPYFLLQACEFFVLELTQRAWAAAEESKRRTLQRSDVATAIARTEVFDFLIDVVPGEEGGGEGVAGASVGAVAVNGSTTVAGAAASAAAASAAAASAAAAAAAAGQAGMVQPTMTMYALPPGMVLPGMMQAPGGGGGPGDGGGMAMAQTMMFPFLPSLYLQQAAVAGQFPPGMQVMLQSMVAGGDGAAGAQQTTDDADGAAGAQQTTDDADVAQPEARDEDK
jgi:hypothetical protein